MADWRSEEFYKERRDELEKRVGPRRFKHSLGVSETAEALARVYGADKTAARMAGLLHDWDKGYDDPGILARADELGMELDAELSCTASRPPWPWAVPSRSCRLRYSPPSSATPWARWT